MVKRHANVFGSSSDSESDAEKSMIVNSKCKKKPPIFDLKENNDRAKPGTKESDADDDYMKYSMDTPEEKDELYDPRRFEGLKYEQVQQVKREEALNKSLLTGKHAEKSIGLSIMERMGFRVGESLGKTKCDKSYPVTNPIEVDIKTNRLGIGASQSKNASHIIPQAEVDVNEYRERIQQAKTKANNICMADKAMKTCFELSGDSERYYNDSDRFKPGTINVLWRPYVIEMIEKKVFTKMRQKVVRIDEDKEQENNDLALISPNLDGADNEYEIYILLDPIIKLQKLLKYMRDNHSYCFFCASSFDSQEDLEKNCPGVHEEDHLDQ